MWLIALGLLLGACSASSDTTAERTLPTPSAGRSDTAPATTPPPNTTHQQTTTTPPACRPASPSDVKVVEATLTNGADHVGESFASGGGRDGYRLIAANIYDGAGARTSSSDVWVIKGEVLFALSGGARSASLAPDGRTIGLSAGSEDALALMACVQAS